MATWVHCAWSIHGTQICGAWRLDQRSPAPSLSSPVGAVHSSSLTLSHFLPVFSELFIPVPVLAPSVDTVCYRVMNCAEHDRGLWKLEVARRSAQPASPS